MTQISSFRDRPVQKCCGRLPLSVRAHFSAGATRRFIGNGSRALFCRPPRLAAAPRRRLSVEFPAGSRIDAAWTDPAVVKQWFGSKPGALEDATINLRPGGSWRFTEQRVGQASTGFEGEYLEVVADELLVFTWAKVTEHRTGHRESTPQSRVEIRFDRDGGGTAMRIVHSNLDTESRAGFNAGWTMGVANLAGLLLSTPTQVS